MYLPRQKKFIQNCVCIKYICIYNSHRHIFTLFLISFHQLICISIIIWKSIWDRDNLQIRQHRGGVHSCRLFLYWLSTSNLFYQLSNESMVWKMPEEKNSKILKHLAANGFSEHSFFPLPSIWDIKAFPFPMPFQNLVTSSLICWCSHYHTDSDEDRYMSSGLQGWWKFARVWWICMRCKSYVIKEWVNRIAPQ